MTPKDALQMIQDNLTPRVLGIFPVEFHIVKEALDHLEQLEKENQEIEKLYLNENKHWCETIDSLRKENQELKEKISKFEKPILYMCRDRQSRELQRLRLLELANKFNVPILLNDFETVKELEKLKKAIEILKEKLKLSLSEYKTIKTINAVLPIGNNEMNRLTQQEYDLLKEVLENV